MLIKFLSICHYKKSLTTLLCRISNFFQKAIENQHHQYENITIVFTVSPISHIITGVKKRMTNFLNDVIFFNEINPKKYE